MVYPTTYTFQPAANGYICAGQTRVGAGALSLNGTGLDVNSAAMNNPRVTLTGSGFARPVSLTSSGTTSTVSFTITGKDIRGAALTEAIAGPVVNTVQTTNYFYEVDSVSTDGTLSTTVSIGIGSKGKSQWYCLDYNKTPVNLGIGVTVSGTDLTWSLVQTTQNPQVAEPAANSIINCSDGSMVSQTASRQGNYVIPFAACQIQIASSSGGSLVANIYEAGIV